GDEQQAALAKMAAALKPGGWLVAEEGDRGGSLQDPRNPPDAFRLVTLYDEGITAAFPSWHPAYGRRLQRDVRDAGLTIMGGSARAGLHYADSPAHELMKNGMPRNRSKVVATGVVSDEEADARIALLSDPNYFGLSGPVVSVWAQKPSATA
ncbi:MAG: hypothetical protein ACSLFM_12020, partial [Tepidiformaceae bacterium]